MKTQKLLTTLVGVIVVCCCVQVMSSSYRKDPANIFEGVGQDTYDLVRQCMGVLTKWIGEYRLSLNASDSQNDTLGTVKISLKQLWEVPTNNVSISSSCRHHIEAMLTDAEDGNEIDMDLKRFSWQMMDSFGKPPSSIRKGNMHWLGDFWQCLDAKLTTGSSLDGSIAPENVFGEYCLVKVFLNGSLPDEPEKVNFISISAKDLVGIKWGMCFPRTCSFQEKEIILKHYAKILGIGVVLSENMCQTAEMKNISFATICWMAILLTPVVLVCLATILEYWYHIRNSSELQKTQTTQNSGFLHQICQIFSTRKSVASLGNSGRERLTCLYGIRFIFAAVVIYIHVTLTILAALPWKNQADVTEVIRKPFNGMWSHGIYIMTIFFYLSGFCLGYAAFSGSNDSRTAFSIVKWNIKRYIRITTPYIYAIAFVAGPLAYLTKGPLRPYAEILSDRCGKNWWRQITYSDNIIGELAHEKCLLGEWYLSTDFQLYIFCTLLVVLLIRKPKLGLIIITAIIVSSTVAMGITLGKSQKSSFISISTAIRNKASMESFRGQFERRAWYRASAYCFGLLAGYLLKQHKSETELSRLVSILGWTAVTLCTIIVNVISEVFVDGQRMPQYLQVFFATVGNLLLCAALTWVILHCTFTPHSWLNSFLSWKIFIPLGKLSYSIYLVQGIFVALRSYSMTESKTLSYQQNSWDACFVIVYSIGAAFMVYLLVESPTERLISTYMSSSKKSTPAV